MKNKITVSIAGQEYTMVAAEGEDYVRRVAALVDSQMREDPLPGPSPRRTAPFWPP